ncbi:N-acyl homoserine lactonase family protein [Microbacterium sp. X-17]|uniref:N-acyl homoserine lactonase family protein n=1 Tax=Microbacterium sp. X-17 TaxID=3144404 RepID=UPI0031F5A0F2
MSAEKTTTTATRIWGLHGPTITLDLGELVVGGSGEITIPVPSFVIEHPRGIVLFDTGFTPEAFGDPMSVYSLLVDVVTIRITESQLLVNQLEAIGFSPTQVTHVVVSHAHQDHTGGLFLFPDAKFYIGAGDLQYAFWPNASDEGIIRRPDLEKTRGFAWHQVPGDLDLFGDGSVVILDMPGHTPGNKSLLVRLPDRTMILAGDTVHVRSALETGMPTPYDYSSKDARLSIERLVMLRDAHDAEVWVNHDPADGEHFGFAAGAE